MNPLSSTDNTRQCSWLTAGLWGLIPGGGHIYLGAWKRGTVIFLVLFLILGFAVYALGKYYTSTHQVLSYKLFNQGKLALAIGLPIWGLSILDAIRLSFARKAGARSRLTWAEFKTGVPDFLMALLFVVLVVDYHVPVLVTVPLWPSFVAWGFFEILSFPVAPVLIHIFLDRRRSVLEKGLGILVLCAALGGFAYAMSPAFGITLLLFIIAKVCSYLASGVSIKEGMHAGRRTLICFLTFFVASFFFVCLFFMMQGMKVVFPSPAGELEMLVLGGMYFALLGVAEVLTFRHQWLK